MSGIQILSNVIQQCEPSLIEQVELCLYDGKEHTGNLTLYRHSLRYLLELPRVTRKNILGIRSKVHVLGISLERKQSFMSTCIELLLLEPVPPLLGPLSSTSPHQHSREMVATIGEHFQVSTGGTTT